MKNYFLYSQYKGVRKVSSEGNSKQEELNNFVNNISRPGKKTWERVKIKTELILSKIKRYTTLFEGENMLDEEDLWATSITDTQVTVLLASEIFTQKLQPMMYARFS